MYIGRPIARKFMSENVVANMDEALLSVVIPAYNEAKTLTAIVHKVLVIPHLLEIIIVDDGSSDGTSDVAKKLAEQNGRVKVVRQKNAGKTAALRTGFALTAGAVVIVQDADLEYDPSEIAGVIEPILNGQAGVVYGSRFLVRKATRVLYFYHYLANKLLTFMSNLLTNLNMTDIETCYKAFRGEIIRNMIIVSGGFGFEVEATAKVAKLGCAIFEVPISYYGRTYAEGKKIGVKDCFMALWLIIRFNLMCGLKQSFREVPNREMISNQKSESSLDRDPNANPLINEPLEPQLKH